MIKIYEMVKPERCSVCGKSAQHKLITENDLTLFYCDDCYGGPEYYQEIWVWPPGPEEITFEPAYTTRDLDPGKFSGVTFKGEKLLLSDFYALRRYGFEKSNEVKCMSKQDWRIVDRLKEKFSSNEMLEAFDILNEINEALFSQR